MLILDFLKKSRKKEYNLVSENHVFSQILEVTL